MVMIVHVQVKGTNFITILYTVYKYILLLDTTSWKKDVSDQTSGCHSLSMQINTNTISEDKHQMQVLLSVAALSAGLSFKHVGSNYWSAHMAPLVINPLMIM